MRKANAGSFKKGHKPAKANKPRIDTADAEIAKRFDAWMNDYTGLGIQGRDKTLGSTANVPFASDVVDADSAREFWRGDAMAAKIIECLPSEALRQGWDLKIGDNQPEPYTPPKVAPVAASPAQSGPMPASAKRPTKDQLDGLRRRDIRSIANDAWLEGRFDDARTIERELASRRLDAADSADIQQAVTKKLTELGLHGALFEALCYERAYGGGAILLGANDYTTDLREPLDLSKVRSLDWLTPLEPRELIPRYYYNNPRAPRCARPAKYHLQPSVDGPADDTPPMPSYTEIHETRLIIFGGIRVSRRTFSTGTLGWGDSILTRVIRALADYAAGHQGAAVLLADFAQAVYKVKNLAELISTDGPGAFMAKVISIDIARSILRAIVVDADGEDYERKSTPMTGFPETLDRLGIRLAAYADMPVTKLYGTSATGLNATGKGDDDNWDDKVKALQTLRVTPPILRVVEIVLRTMGEDPDTLDYGVKFRPLTQPTELETAQAHAAQAQADLATVNADIASPEEIALSRFGGDCYSYETHIDFDARAAQDAVVAPIVDANPKPVPPIGVNAPVLTESGPMPAAAGQPAGAAPDKNEA